MASHRLSVFTQEELAEQARLVFASRARAVPPPARSAPLPARQSPDHLCRVGSPHPGCPQGGGAPCHQPSARPARGDTPRPPTPDLHQSSISHICLCHAQNAQNPRRGGAAGRLPLGDSSVPGAACQAAPHPVMGGGAACRAGVIRRTLHKISPVSCTGKIPRLQVSRRRQNAPAA